MWSSLFPHLLDHTGYYQPFKILPTWVKNEIINLASSSLAFPSQVSQPGDELSFPLLFLCSKEKWSYIIIMYKFIFKLYLLDFLILNLSCILGTAFWLPYSFNLLRVWGGNILFRLFIIVREVIYSLPFLVILAWFFYKGFARSVKSTGGVFHSFLCSEIPYIT